MSASASPSNQLPVSGRMDGLDAGRRRGPGARARMDAAIEVVIEPQIRHNRRAKCTGDY